MLGAHKCIYALGVISLVTSECDQQADGVAVSGRNQLDYAVVRCTSTKGIV